MALATAKVLLGKVIGTCPSGTFGKLAAIRKITEIGKAFAHPAD